MPLDSFSWQRKQIYKENPEASEIKIHISLLLFWLCHGFKFEWKVLIKN